MLFSHDKIVATFTGRLPSLSARFVSTSLPLDLADKELLNCYKHNDVRHLELDAHGWNMNGEIYGKPTQDLEPLWHSYGTKY